MFPCDLTIRDSPAFTVARDEELARALCKNNGYARKEKFVLKIIITFSTMSLGHMHLTWRLKFFVVNLNVIHILSLSD